MKAPSLMLNECRWVWLNLEEVLDKESGGHLAVIYYRTKVEDMPYLLSETQPPGLTLAIQVKKGI